MSRRAMGGDLDPEGRLLGGPHAVVLDAPGGAGADRAPFVEQELGVLHQLRMMLDHPTRPHAGAHVLVRRREEDDVPLERHAGAFEREQCHELRNRLALHVECATPPQIAVLHRPGEGVDLPVFRAREHHVHVVQQDQRPGAAVSGEARVQVRLSGLRLEDLRADSLAREHRLEPLGRLELVARRVGGVDRDVLRQERRGLPADGAPVAIRAREAGLTESRGQEHRLTGRAEHAGLGRSDGLRRPRAGSGDDQGQQGSAAHESSRQGNGGTRKLPATEAWGEPPPQCTVIVAWPVLPSLVALKRTLPTARAWTIASSPYPCRVTIVLSLVDQDTARLGSKLPAASRKSARTVTLSPTARVAVSGTTVTVATGAAAATLMLASPVFPSLVARSEANPGARARTKAEVFAIVIFTTDVSVLNHETDRLLRLFPAESRSCAVNAALSPAVRLALAGTTVTVATGAGAEGGSTVIVACPVLPWLVANTVALPGARPTAKSPLHDAHGYTKTTVVSELNQDAPPPREWPAESRNTAWRDTPLSPTVIVALAGSIVTVARFPSTTTWTASESVKPPLAARIVATPAWRPVTETVIVSCGPRTAATKLSLLAPVICAVNTPL